MNLVSYYQMTHISYESFNLEQLLEKLEIYRQNEIDQLSYISDNQRGFHLYEMSYDEIKKCDKAIAKIKREIELLNVNK
nr:putative BTB/POZ domain-containing protein [Megavirus caiporensis]